MKNLVKVWGGGRQRFHLGVIEEVIVGPSMSLRAPH
jgi:hypothetical protein